MSNGTIHRACEITAAIDEIGEYLRTGDENRQALMHANLLLTDLMRLLRPIKRPANTALSVSRMRRIETVGVQSAPQGRV